MVCFSVKVEVQPPTPVLYNPFKWCARIPLRAFNKIEQSLFAHVVKTLERVKILSLNSVR